MAGPGFEVLLTVDQNFRHQQNLSASGVAVVVMVAPSNRLADLVPLIPGVEAALSSIQAGDAVEVRTQPVAQLDRGSILVSRLYVGVRPVKVEMEGGVLAELARGRMWLWLRQPLRSTSERATHRQSPFR